ncbi:MAG: hypothetical protein CL993_04170 [Euryarchaeota archaeon]|nr:hypothetical protein [Euryarchaeota archaeon]
MILVRRSSNRNKTIEREYKREYNNDSWDSDTDPLQSVGELSARSVEVSHDSVARNGGNSRNSILSGMSGDCFCDGQPDTR